MKSLEFGGGVGSVIFVLGSMEETAVCECRSRRPEEIRMAQITGQRSSWK